MKEKKGRNYVEYWGKMKNDSVRMCMYMLLTVYLFYFSSSWNVLRACMLFNSYIFEKKLWEVMLGEEVSSFLFLQWKVVTRITWTASSCGNSASGPVFPYIHVDMTFPQGWDICICIMWVRLGANCGERNGEGKIRLVRVWRLYDI